MVAPPTNRWIHVTRRALALAAALMLLCAPAALAQLPGDPIGGVGDAVGGIGDPIGGGDTGGGSGGGGGGVGDAVGGTVGGVGDAVGNVGDSVDETVDEVGDGTGDTIGDVGGGVGDTIGGDVGDKVGDVSKDAGKTVGDNGGKAGGAVGDAGKNVGGSVGGAGNVVEGAIKGIPLPGGELLLGGGKGKNSDGPNGTYVGSNPLQWPSGLPAMESSTVTEPRDLQPHKEYSTPPTVTSDDQSMIEQLAQAAAEAAKRFAFPLALALVVGGFLMLQNRLDNRDRKLALAPVDAEQDLLTFK